MFAVAIWIAGSAALQSPGCALRALRQGRTVLYLSIFTGVITWQGRSVEQRSVTFEALPGDMAPRKIHIVAAWWVALAITTSGEIHKSRSGLRRSASAVTDSEPVTYPGGLRRGYSDPAAVFAKSGTRRLQIVSRLPVRRGS
jgi:hypothetical protein